MSQFSITLLIVGFTVLISYQSFNNSNMKNKLLFRPASIKEFGEWYRFLTHGLVHANWEHLIVNMYVLYIFGEFLELYMFNQIFSPTIGRLVFVLFYFSAVVVASIPSYFKHQDNPHYLAVGASGATSALVFSYILANDPWSWFIFPPLPAILLAIGYLWYSSYMEKRGIDNIGHNAHFWGAVYGLVFTLVIFLNYAPQMLERFFVLFLEGPRLPAF